MKIKWCPSYYHLRLRFYSQQACMDSVYINVHRCTAVYIAMDTQVGQPRLGGEHLVVSVRGGPEGFVKHSDSPHTSRMSGI